MAEESKVTGGETNKLVFNSLRFGQIEVPRDTLITFPAGLIGFPTKTQFVVLEHKPPFSWLHSVEDPALAFVVVDGFEFGDNYKVFPPYGDIECGFVEGEEYAVLVIITVRTAPGETTANLKAPLFVNLKNRKGVQVIFDDQKYSTRHPLWTKAEEEEEGK